MKSENSEKNPILVLYLPYLYVPWRQRMPHREYIPDEYLWPEMRKSFYSSKKAPTSFHTFSMVDGPSSYLQSNRENSKRLGKKVKEELGSLGRTLIENLESIENETEFNAGHAFVRPGFKYFPISHVSNLGSVT